MSLDVESLVQDMLGAAEGVVKDKWPATRQYFESETKMLAERLASIEKMRLAGTISEARAKLHLDFQKEAYETVLLSVEGLNQLLIETALNAALDAVKKAVNTAVGFILL
jgi:hypothetical protein